MRVSPYLKVWGVSSFNFTSSADVALENYWNGAILNSVEAARYWATNMTSEGVAPVVHCIEVINSSHVLDISVSLECDKAWVRNVRFSGL
ncbi:MAG: hypothetical protein PUP91_15265 [Rhizonema sp. PD37]|nr:hypothetical protein [Rhizonema sp. PD37]